MPPVCLIRQNGDRMEICPDGIALLQSLKHEPVAVICLAGQYRTGKSFFLNQMCRNKLDESEQSSEGFVVGPTTESCTRGIWIWDAKQCNSRGEKVLLMDTEGIASTDNDETYDAKIFSLGLLLSSVFVFNTMGVIDEGAIDRLFLVSELTKHVCIHQNKSNSAPLSMSDEMELASINEESLAPHFPPFVWLLRDFLLDIQENGVELSPNDYLERSLQKRDGTSKRIEERNRIRQSLRTLFRQRECLTLVRPAMDEEKLRYASQLSEDELRPEFVSQMASIRERILDLARPKLVLNQVIDGSMLCHLVQSYIEAMNSGAMPDIKAAWDYVSEVTCEAAYFHALETYKEVMATNTSMAQQEFERVYKEAQEASLAVFKKESVEGEARKKCFQNLKQAISQDKTEQIASLQQKSTQLCTTVLERLSQQLIKHPIENGEWDDIKSISFITRLTPFFQAYDVDGDGPAKTKMLLQFVKKDLLTYLELIVVRMDHRHDSLLESIKNASDETKQEYERARRQLEQECHSYQMEGTRLHGIVSTLEEKIVHLNSTNVQLNETNGQLQQQLQTSDEKRKQTKQDLEELKQQFASLEMERSRFETLVDHTQQTLQQTVKEKENLHSQLTSQLAEVNAERTKEREISISNLAKQAAEIHNLQKNLKSTTIDLEETTRQNGLLMKEKELLSQRIKGLIEVHEEMSVQLANMNETHEEHTNDNERLQRRCERLEQELGDINVQSKVEIVMEKCILDVIKQHESDKIMANVVEEKAALQATLGELHEKISTLPDFYQRQVFCSEEPVPDFFEALTSFLGK